MLKFMRRPGTIIKYVTNTLKKLPTSTSHLKLYWSRFVNEKIGGFDRTQSSKAAIQNEILIYQNENSRFFLKLSVLSIINYTFWSLLGVSTYQLVSEIPENSSDWGLFADERQRQCVKYLAILTLVLGTLLIFSVWLFILRSIKTITLRKESQDVIFETFTPFYTIRRFIVPLSHVSGVMSRHKVKGYVPLKIKNNLFYFLVDVNGKFISHSVFDSTIALKRHFKD